ncbi:MAG: hypothetical protein ACKOER_09095, partial [Betaproteobacteria bacterium]
MNDQQQPNPLRDVIPPDATALPAGAGAEPAGAQARGSDTMERVLTELIRDRRAERRWRSVFRLAWLLVAIALIWTLSPSRGLS